ncbi:POTRA domain-containing protein [Seonamhaeicola aphaedonensis]|uniref:Surface antigen-like variable number repeat protein n=1 Tax=Seonamhaeicola aphaedonensis TaxID=1461338 RepID=A0A3D9HKN3_9FLAO|nr:POTRA domain-containing protein [Seonamhaeicola aphaedonensis]RED50034.1 surface antigen-like variable number repeat protein [Seonamhaeicola aphaedonensis]
MKNTVFQLLTILVFFSPQVFCQNLKLGISGSSPKETQIIDSLNYSKNHKDFLSLKTEIDEVQKQLYKIGFIENRLDSIQHIKDSIYKTKFQLKKRFSTIHIYYDKKTVSKSILQQISKDLFDDYFELKFIEIENALNFINSKISERGFPFSKLKLSNITIKDQYKLKAHLEIENNDNKRTINKIIVKGYEKFPEAYLKHFLKIKPSQIFDLNKIKTKTEQLQNLRFASEVKPPEILFSKDSTTIYLYLQKIQSNSFDGFLGFGTNEETNKIEFDGYLNLNLTNNLNFGESFTLLYKSDENDQKTFQTSLTLPYLFKSPVGLDLSLNIFKKDSTFTTVNQSAKIHYQISTKHKISSGFLFEESNNLLTNNTFTAISDYEKNFISFSYEFIKPQNNNALFPINSYVYLETNFGNRKETSQKEKQSLFQINAYNIFNLNDKNSLYIRTNGAVINSNSYFENELLRFGGINSIRGFEENSLFASLYGLINTEYRFQLNNAIYLHSVIDAAYFENKTSNLSQKLFSYGFGFGILTKSGLFKLNYANGKRENEQFKLSNSKVHISLTTIF